jgi:hypothetical protein
VIGVGDHLPPARVWLTADDAKPVSLGSLAGEGPFLLLFYLFDWTST